VYLILELWTIEAGLLTPMLTVKRDVVQRMLAWKISFSWEPPPKADLAQLNQEDVCIDIF
jgi:hypothetical protein